jgi:hypothetical protein
MRDIVDGHLVASGRCAAGQISQRPRDHKTYTNSRCWLPGHDSRIVLCACERYCFGTLAAIWWAMLTAESAGLKLHAEMSIAMLLVTVSAR